MADQAPPCCPCRVRLGGVIDGRPHNNVAARSHPIGVTQAGVIDGKFILDEHVWKLLSRHGPYHLSSQLPGSADT